MHPLRIVALVAVAIGITLSTGELHMTGWGYGLPLPWKLDWAGDSASPFHPPACPLVRNGIFFYIWYFFVLDVLFYIALGYGVILGFERMFKGPGQKTGSERPD